MSYVTGFLFLFAILLVAALMAWFFKDFPFRSNGSNGRSYFRLVKCRMHSYVPRAIFYAEELGLTKAEVDKIRGR
jgi:hypothetical protein